MIAMGALAGAAVAVLAYYAFPEQFTTATIAMLVFACAFLGAIVGLAYERIQS